jgi:hypothetical protein
LITCSIAACTGQKGEITPVRINLPVSKVIADTLFLSFPGELRVTDKYILLQTVRSNQGFMKIYDRETGEDLAWIGNIGQGPAEWTTPMFGNVINDKLLVYDLNTKKYVIASADNMFADISNQDKIKKMDLPRFMFLNYVDDTTLIAGIWESDAPFMMVSDVKTKTGQYFIKEKVSGETAIESLYGNFTIHPKQHLFAYGMAYNPYLALYRIKENSLEMLWEKQFKEPDYTIVDGQIKWGKRHPGGIGNLTFTKDYIAFCTEDEVNKDKTFTIVLQGREMKAPLTSIYLCDYDGNLRYILDPELLINSLTSDINSNKLYAVGLDPDFRIVMFDVDKAISEYESKKGESGVTLMDFYRSDIKNQIVLSNPEEIVFDDLLDPWAFYVMYDTLVVVNNSEKCEYGLELYSLNSMSQVAQFASKGQGPEDFLSFTCFVHSDFDSAIYACDRQTNRYCVIDLPKSIAEKRLNISRQFRYDASELHWNSDIILPDDDHYIGYNFWYLPVEKYNNGVEALQRYPINHSREYTGGAGLIPNAHPYLNASVNNANLLFNPKTKHIWLLDGHQDRISIYDDSLCLMKTVIGPDHYNIEYIDEINASGLNVVLFSGDKDYKSYSGAYTITESGIYIRGSEWGCS